MKHAPPQTRRAPKARAAKQPAAQAAPARAYAARTRPSNDPALLVERARRTPRATLPYREQLGRLFPRSLDGLEVHRGGDAAEICRELGARAFAVKNVLVFAEALPALARVLHEVVHAIQQGGDRDPAPARFAPGSLAVADPGHRAEQEARAVTRGEPPPGGLSPQPTAIYRDISDLPELLEDRLKILIDYKPKLKMIEWADGSVARFGVVAKGTTTRNPTFKQSSDDSWRRKDLLDAYQNKQGVGAKATDDDAGKDVQKLFADTTAKDSVAQGFTYGAYVYRSAKIDTGAEDKLTIYTFVGKAFGTSTQYYGEVHDRTRDEKKDQDFRKTLDAYEKMMTAVVALPTIAPNKAVFDPVIKDIADAKAETDDTKLPPLVEAIRHKFEPLIVDQYLGKLSLLHTEVISSKIFAGSYARIKGTIFEQWVMKNHPVDAAGNPLDTKRQPLFILDAGKATERTRQGDGMSGTKGSFRIVEAKAYTGPANTKLVAQMKDYGVVVASSAGASPITGKFTPAGADEPWNEPFVGVDYFFSDVTIAGQWEPDIKKNIAAGRYTITPNPSAKKKQKSKNKTNPVFEIEVDTSILTPQTFAEKDLPQTHPGLKLQSAELTLANEGSPAVASGKITMSMGEEVGGIKKPGAVIEPKTSVQVIEPVAEAINPATAATAEAHGRFASKTPGVKSKLDDFLKRVKTTAQVTENGLFAGLEVEPGDFPGLPGFLLTEGKLTAELTKAGPALSGTIMLGHTKWKGIEGGLTISYAKDLLTLAGKLKLSNVVDGLEPFTLSVTYTRGTDATGASTTNLVAEVLDTVKVKRQIGSVLITGSAVKPKYDVNAQTFSCEDVTLTADLGAFGTLEATKAQIENNQLKTATLSYKSPTFSYPKVKKPTLISGGMKGTLTYTAPAQPGESAKFGGTLEGTAAITAAPLKKLAKDGTIALKIAVTIKDDGTYEGSIKTESEILLGTHFKIPSIEAKLDAAGNFSFKFQLELINVGPVKSASATLKISEEKGLELEAASITIKVADPKGGADKFVGTVSFVNDPIEGITISGQIDYKIKEGLIASGKATYRHAKDELDASLTLGEIPLFNFGPEQKKIFGIEKNIELFSIYKVLGVYLKLKFELLFEYLFKLAMKPTISVEGLKMSDFSFRAIKATIELPGKLEASLIAIPEVGLGLFILSTQLLRGGGGLKLPLKATASLVLQPPDNVVEFYYSKDGGVGADAKVGLTLMFGITAALIPVAEFVVLDGAWEKKWEGTPLKEFVIMEPRPVFTYVHSFGKPFKQDDKPGLPEGKAAPAKPEGGKQFEGKVSGGDKTAPAVKSEPETGTPDKKPDAENEGGFDFIGLVKMIFGDDTFAAFEKVAKAAGDAWDAIVGAIGRVVDFIKKWLGAGVDLIVGALKAIKNKAFIPWVRDTLLVTLLPAPIYRIIKPMVNLLVKVEQDVWDFLLTPIPTEIGEVIDWAFDLIKKALNIGFSNFRGLKNALTQMLANAKDETEGFIDYLIKQRKLGIRRHPYWLVGWHLYADEYKAYFGGLDVYFKEEGIADFTTLAGEVIYGVLAGMSGVAWTDTSIEPRTGDPRNDLWAKERPSAGGVMPHAPAAVARASHDRGTPLPDPLAQRFGRSLGADLSGVRVHTGAASAHAADALGARAFTAGRDIHFGAGEYQPRTPAGQRLIAHEVAHTTQPVLRAGRTHYGLLIGPRDHAGERAADAMAPSMVAGRPVSARSDRAAISREELDNGATPTRPSDWTTADREGATQRWEDANLTNLKALDSAQYRRVVERRDFYKWFYGYSAKKGFTTRWALAASVVASGANLIADMNPIAENFATPGTVTNELQGFMREGNQVIFDNVFPKLRMLLFEGTKKGTLVERKDPIQGAAALQWDMKILSEEQTLIQPLYDQATAETKRLLDAGARQKPLGAGFAAGFAGPNAGPYNRGGPIPAFTGTDIYTVGDRWSYGMQLGLQFGPVADAAAVKFDPTKNLRPDAAAGYKLGTELAKVRTRTNLHLLDAELDDLQTTTKARVTAILGQLTPKEQAELLTDRSPDRGKPYSQRLSLLTSLELRTIVLTWRVDPESQLRFLRDHFGSDNLFVLLAYADVAPMILAATPAQREKLHTAAWRDAFLKICSSTTIRQAVNDLLLPPAKRAEWLAARP